MEMKYGENLRTRETFGGKQKNLIRVSPVRTRNSATFQNTSKPFGSSIIKQKKSPTTKEDILKLNTKLEIIRSKCMAKSSAPKLGRRTELDPYDDDDQVLNESVDIESLNEFNNKQKNKKAYIIFSPFKNRPPTIFFQYPQCCGVEPLSNLRVKQLDKFQLYYKIYGSEYKCIVNSLEHNGFKRADDEDTDWNILFDITGVHTKEIQGMSKHQKINHFPGCWNLGRKDYMWRHLNKQRRTNPQAYNFVPTTYLFPTDFQRFQIIREGANKNTLWIMKPSNQACGRGIKMINKETQIKNRKDYLVSEYIANPHLINTYKYDLRIYILVTSYDPLRIYMFKEGLVRFATYSYSNKIKDLKKRFIHLTNFSVNKHSKKFVKNNKAEQDGQGSKWSLTALKKYYQENGINHQALFEEIKNVMIKTCISAEPVMLDIHSKTQQKRSCGFQIYGFDILVDSNLKPWLMEVNVCPSLSSSSPMDRRIKHTLLTDTLNLIGLEYPNPKNIEIDKNKSRLYNINNNERKIYSKNIANLQKLTYSNCIETLTPDDWLVLFQSQQQMHRLGNFQRIFPKKHNIDTMKDLFEFNRYNNNVLWKNIKSDKNFLERLYK